ncbi:MAG: hypothetical protein NT046_07950 [Arenimonas sp.]|nr:hypothetical protein [Arenimonas sp.]
MRRARLRGFAAALALVLASVASASDAAPADIESRALRAAESLGLNLYRADRTAWLTTDQLMDQGLVGRDGSAKRIPGNPTGWVTAPTATPSIWSVAYLSEVDGKQVAFADGTVDFASEPLASLRENTTPRPLEANEVLQLRLRDDARSREWMSCSRAAYNTATLPDGHGGWAVYLMPPHLAKGVYPLGGFHRFSYDAEGRFLDHYSHTRSCLSHDESNAPEGAISAVMVSHITSALPNEIHVFMNLSYGLPVFVATQDQRLWKIEGGRIGQVDQDAPAQ